MSEVLNLKYMLPERLHGRYISNDQIKRDPRPRDADIDTLAHVLVSERHGKFDLVRLVAYLLRECASTQADDAQDAARYRWLRTHWGRIADEYDGDSDQLVAIREADSHFEGWYVDPVSLDRAIDAAMQRTSDGGEE